MTLHQFLQAMEQQSAPVQLSNALAALWQDKRGDWQMAHELVRHELGQGAAWVHAYLHRKEGDLSNARYWYQRAARQPAQGCLESEWRNIASTLLSQYRSR